MPRRQSSREFHVVVLGAGGVGKSCLTAQFVHNEWIESYDPTIEDSYRTQLSVDGRAVMLEILDTAGTEQFVAMRDLYIKSGHGFLLVFSITSMSSFAELSAIRDEIIHVKDDEFVPMVIVGNKADLEDAREVPKPRAFALSQLWMVPYYETSAKRKSNVDEIFIDICRQMLRRDDELQAKADAEDGDMANKGPSGHRRRRRGRKKSDQRCIIL